MPFFGKQIRYCPNCGKKLYDTNVCMDRVQPMQCSPECRDSWEIKYTRMILGKDAEDDPSQVQKTND